jgi:D-alanyl-D-alanine dipeptidase
MKTIILKNSELEKMIHQPIELSYRPPSDEFYDWMKENGEQVILNSIPTRMLFEHSYFRAGIRGTRLEVLTRGAVAKQLLQAQTILETAGYQLVIYDLFRTPEAQLDLFSRFYQAIAEKNPDLSPEQVHQKARTFVFLKDERSGFQPPPHTTGGAADVGLADQNGPLPMGSDFDEVSDRSATAYFESPWVPDSGISEADWVSYRTRRRILFHTLVLLGFTNYSEEWWHFDLGNWSWAQHVARQAVFETMETEN